MDKQFPVLVCRNKYTNEIKSIDTNRWFCRKQFFYFGKWVPTYDCGNKDNIHTCELMTEYQLRDYYMESKK